MIFQRQDNVLRFQCFLCCCALGLHDVGNRPARSVTHIFEQEKAVVEKCLE
jgi:hypothetical protein